MARSLNPAPSQAIGSNGGLNICLDFFPEKERQKETICRTAWHGDPGSDQILLAQDIRFLLHYLQIDFEDKRYPPGPNFGDDHWLAEKFELGLDFPNVPYYIEGDVKLSESRAILKYLARTKAPELMPATPVLKAKAEILEGVLVDLYQKLILSVYSKDAPPIPLEVSLDPKFVQIAKFVGKNRFVLGEQLHWIDFFLYEVLVQFGRYSPGMFAAKHEILQYVKNFEAIPELQEYLNSPTVLQDICLSRKGRVVF